MNDRILKMPVVSQWDGDRGNRRTLPPYSFLTMGKPFSLGVDSAGDLCMWFASPHEFEGDPCVRVRNTMQEERRDHPVMKWAAMVVWTGEPYPIGFEPVCSATFETLMWHLVVKKL